MRDVHRAVFQRDQNTVTLTVADVGTVLAAALEKLRPALARRVEARRARGAGHARLDNVSATLARRRDGSACSR